MGIGITEEHGELASSLRGWAAALEGREAARRAEGEPAATFDEVVKAAAEMGVTTIALPESAGGGGGSTLDLAVALEACAHELLPGPLLTSAVTATLVGRDERCALALDPGLRVVLDLPGATQVLLPVGHTGADGWWVVPAAAVDGVPSVGLDLTRRTASGRLGPDALDPLTGAVRLPGVTTEVVRRTVVVLAAAEAAGVARWCLDTATAYAKVREQFGQPIGAFQAVKHLCAEMLETVEAVAAAAWDAASAADEVGQGAAEQAAYAADVAHVTCVDGAVEVAKTCIQVLGGIGFTFEHDAHLYLRRALALRALVGDPDEAAERLADRAAGGTRRRVQVDLDGRDEEVRDDVRATVERIAAAGPEERRTLLVETGYLTPHWPAPAGLAADAVTQLVIDQELAEAGVERPDIVIAAWALPTILEHGSDAQRERFVRPSLLGELVWCQLFSEPGSGSDLASLRTRATKVDGGWRLDGQKVWTSLADEADWGICLARTDPDAPPHRGIGYFLVDMRSPGLDVRPLREITGEALFNEVFLDGVVVPDDCLVAGPTDGWRLARTTLANERVAMAGSRLDTSVERAVALLADPGRTTTGRERAAVGRAVALATVCGLLATRTALRSLDGRGPGPESSVAKLLGVRNRQDAAELVVRLHGADVLAAGVPARDAGGAESAVWELLNTRCLSIAGGTTQVLRNVAGERILGLPRG
ncbi:acyl-CoA dehydrogenase [Nocardioides litoris]|uniref:acyl-CoA dehydrogenase n=1 Tax=Nocardioides litoris TaxID=1926648 RepID=UPI0011248295|nr:acyl-CoA dehydrogenase [Nocardioides litoris]